MSKTTKSSYRDNPLLKRVGIEYQYTEEEVKEYVKCSQDIIYFTKKYVKIVNVDRGLINFELWDFQEELINTYKNNRFVITKCPRQVGKCLQINTPIRLKNKKTGDIMETTIGEFYEQQRKQREEKLLREEQGKNPETTTGET